MFHDWATGTPYLHKFLDKQQFIRVIPDVLLNAPLVSFIISLGLAKLNKQSLCLVHEVLVTFLLQAFVVIHHLFDTDSDFFDTFGIELALIYDLFEQNVAISFT